MSLGFQQARRIHRELGQFARHWRYTEAVRAHRIERRLGRYLTDAELGRTLQPLDALFLRQFWLESGGKLVIRDGRLDLSTDLPRRKPR